MRLTAQEPSDRLFMATQEALKYLRSQSEAPSRGLVLLTACCGVFAGFGSVVGFTLGVFLKPLTVEFGWTRAEVSLAFTIAAITVAAYSPLIGRLLHRCPAARV